jgi:diazepam-binding inhibitor (GABA receptor modulator, acyl-CoA-binding protein)
MMGEIYELLNDLFQEHAKKIQLYHNNSHISNKNLLELYGLYKQGIDGDVLENNNFRTFKEKKMYESWINFKGKSKEECKQLFIEKVNNIMRN